MDEVGLLALAATGRVGLLALAATGRVGLLALGRYGEGRLAGARPLRGGN